MKVRKRVRRIRFVIIKWTTFEFCMGELSVLCLIGFWSSADMTLVSRFFVVGCWW